MKEQMYFNEFTQEICAGDRNYAIQVLQEWLDQLENMEDEEDWLEEEDK